MPRLIESPALVTAAGTPPKRIEEFVGRASTGHTTVSVARMVSPPGWSEPAQQPEFEEITIVLQGAVVVESNDGPQPVQAGQAVVVTAGEKVRYSTPDGAQYVSVCLPAFSPQSVHRSKRE